MPSRYTKAFAATILATTALTTGLTAAPALAQDAPPAAAPEEPAPTADIIVTGTRTVGQQVAQSAAPIQLLNEEALAHVGQPNLNQALTQLVPSFQAQTQGTDMSSFSLSARLRGISPNHTLVMVNGKRRHGNSILQVINGAFGGSAAPSIDLIPPDIVKRIEVLQDGAAAQYGTDAIAGVINIILKSDTSGVTMKGTAGQYYDGEGATYSASTNIGLPIGSSGYLDISLFHRRNDFTTIGDGQFSVRNLDGKRANNIPTLFQPIYDSIIARGADANINGGQPKSQLNLAFYNAGYDFGGVELYSFGDVSYRHGDALQGYRIPRRVCDTSAGTDPALCLQRTITNGMVPHIEVKQQEFSVTNGLRLDVADWNVDASVTYAEDKSTILTTHSAAATLYADAFAKAKAAAIAGGATVAAANATATAFANASAPDYFYDGSFKFTQFVGNLDIKRPIEIGFVEPLNFAFGFEYRKETYALTAGDAQSTYFEGGQSFPGYTRGDASSLKRNVQAGYIDLAFKPVEGWSVDVAGRFEHYSDFGNTTIGKLTTRYDFSPAFALRGTVSTGFRAPTLQEAGYSSTSVGPTSAILQLAPSSPGATAAGFGALKPEKSLNLSGGVVLRPVPRLIVTLDGYYIKIRDRIVSSGNIIGRNAVPVGSSAAVEQAARVLTPLINGLTPYDLVRGAILASGKGLDPSVVDYGQIGLATFTNGIDTRTFGLEFSARYPIDTGIGKFDLSLSANYNKTKVTKSKLGTLFNSNSFAVIEKASPDFKSVFSTLYTSGKFAANLRATYYSKTTQLVQPNSLSTATRPIADIWGGPGYYEGVVKGAMIFDLEVSYDVTDFANIAIGANNLLNKKPEVPGLVADYDPNNASWRAATRSPYVNNGGSINAPYTFGPYGTNGGYYYARLTAKF
jgi:iron complex outermembrane receptor protein